KISSSIKPFYIILFIFLFIVMIGSIRSNIFRANTSAINTSKKQTDFSISSFVPDLTVIESSIQDDHVFLTVRNDSSRSITAYSISSGNVTYTSDNLGTSNVISPGSIFTKGIVKSTPNIKGVFVETAIYEDGSAGGKEKYIKQLLDARAGKQAQL